MLLPQYRTCVTSRLRQIDSLSGGFAGPPVSSWLTSANQDTRLHGSITPGVLQVFGEAGGVLRRRHNVHVLTTGERVFCRTQHSATISTLRSYSAPQVIRHCTRTCVACSFLSTTPGVRGRFSSRLIAGWICYRQGPVETRDRTLTNRPNGGTRNLPTGFVNA